MRRVTIEEYLEKIYELSKEKGVANTGQIAEEMNIKPPSVTQMLQKLADEGLVNYNPYQGATLTTKGMKKAEQLMHKHKVLSDFLMLLGIDDTVAEEDACRIEHQISPETVTQLRRFLEHMKTSTDGKACMDGFRKENTSEK